MLNSSNLAEFLVSNLESLLKSLLPNSETTATTSGKNRQSGQNRSSSLGDQDCSGIERKLADLSMHQRTIAAELEPMTTLGESDHSETATTSTTTNITTDSTTSTTTGM